MEHTTRRFTADDDVRHARRASLLTKRGSQRPKCYTSLPRMHAFRRRHMTFSPDVTMYFQTRWSDQDYRNARIGRWILSQPIGIAFRDEFRNLTSFFFDLIHKTHEFVFFQVY